jgi:hypothetical protein
MVSASGTAVVFRAQHALHRAVPARVGCGQEWLANHANPRGDKAGELTRECPASLVDKTKEQGGQRGVHSHDRTIAP